MLYRGDDGRRNARLAEIAGQAGVPLIAVNDVLYHAPKRRALQDIITCIRAHTTIDAAGRLLEANAERHFKPPAEMARLFRKVPDAVRQTKSFLDACRFSLDELKNTEYPDETRKGFATPQDALVAFAQAGAQRRYPDGIPAKVRHALAEELRLIGELNYAPFFLTVHDVVQFARVEEKILCQGRGSAANSVICYCLGITDVDPLKIDLLFERFVSAERREPPDIDVDFEHERREKVIQHIYQTYTRERAGLAATVICYRGRSAIRDVGKVFGLSQDTIGALASSLWGWSMDGVSAQEARRIGLDPADRRLKMARSFARVLTGFPAICPSMWAASSSPAAGSMKWCRSRMPPWRIAPSSNGTRTISMPSGCSRSMCWGSACCPACGAPSSSCRRITGLRAISPCRTRTRLPIA